jgi:transposase
MARTRGKLDQKEEAAEVLRLLEKEPPGWRKERLLALKHGMERKLSTQEIADAIGRGKATIYLWFKTFRERGLSAVLSKESGKGFAPALDDEQMEVFAQELAKGQWRTGHEAYAWLQKTYGVSFHPQRIYVYLKKLKGRLKVPRPSHAKQDAEKVEHFKRDLTQKLMNFNLDRRKPLRLWIYDEMRYGLAPVTRRMWGLRGVPLVAPVHHRYQWGYLYGAIQVGGGGSEFLFSPTVSKEVDAIFLHQIAARDPGANHVIIGDGAGFHHHAGKDHGGKLAENIHLITLPPYSPELNPVESLWDQFKDKICNQVFASLEELEAKLEEQIQLYWKEPKRLFNLVGHGYLSSKLNFISDDIITPDCVVN